MSERNTEPERFVGHWYKDDRDDLIYAGRNRNSEGMDSVPVGERGWLGNPYRLEDGYSREESVQLFEEFLQDEIHTNAELASALAGVGDVLRSDGGKTALGCYCQRLDELDGDLCHAEVIARYALALSQSN